MSRYLWWGHPLFSMPFRLKEVPRLVAGKLHGTEKPGTAMKTVQNGSTAYQQETGNSKFVVYYRCYLHFRAHDREMRSSKCHQHSDSVPSALAPKC